MAHPKFSHSKDANHNIIAEGLERSGFQIAHTHRALDGFPDICVAVKPFNVLIEVKAEKADLTKHEKEFFIRWDAMRVIARDPEEALNFCYSVREEWARIERMLKHISGSTGTLANMRAWAIEALHSVERLKSL